MPSICGLLDKDFDKSCITEVVREYEQEVVIINKSDIDPESVTINVSNGVATCEHSVEFTLLSGKTGYKLSLPVNGGSVFATYDKTSNENYGFPQYNHVINIAVIGLSEADKCYLRTLDKGLFVAGLRPKGTELVEIFGFTNGLKTGDYTFDIVGGLGGTQLTLTSKENSPESNIPFIYKPAVGGNAVADFDAKFENIP